jgi:hypothetical protein
VNHYGMQAMRHYKEHLPQRYAQIQDPGAFFTSLGNQAASQVTELMMDLAGDDPPGETYLQKTGRINMARLRAEEMVRAELILPDPATDSQEPPDGS